MNVDNTIHNFNKPSVVVGGYVDNIVILVLFERNDDLMVIGEEKCNMNFAKLSGGEGMIIIHAASIAM